MKVSVTALAYNLAKEGILPAVLEAWCRQTVQPDEYVVVDSQSEDNTVEVIEQYKDRIPVRVVVRPTRDGWCLYTTKYGIDNTDGDIVIIDYMERLWRDDYIETMTRNLQSDEWRVPACGFIYDGIKHADVFSYKNGDNDIDNILTAPFDKQWERAKELSHVYVYPSINPYWCEYSGYTRPACCASFYREQWDMRIGELPTDPETLFDNDRWYQTKVWTTEDAVNTIKELMVIHLYHTRIEHGYWRHPTKTWRDDPNAIRFLVREFANYHERFK